MKYLKLDLWHNSQAPFGIATYRTGSMHISGDTWEDIRKQLRELADNVSAIKLERSGVTRLTINTDDRFICQASGYSWNRGAFCDVIAAETRQCDLR